jgi:ABC-type proline/glycine betaine transport system substrate-binding protein
MRKHWPLMLLAALAGAALALLAACGSMTPAPTSDRQGANGNRADFFQDAQKVTIWRNADTVPNVATFCLGQYGFATTLKTSSTNGGDTSPSLQRFPEMDKACTS